MVFEQDGEKAEGGHSRVPGDVSWLPGCVSVPGTGRFSLASAQCGASSEEELIPHRARLVPMPGAVPYSQLASHPEQPPL